MCFGSLGVHMGNVLYVFWLPGSAYGKRFVCVLVAYGCIWGAFVLVAWGCIWGASCMCFGRLGVHMLKAMLKARLKATLEATLKAMLKAMLKVTLKAMLEEFLV